MQQRVFVLDRRNTRQTVLFGGSQETRGAPCAFVRQADRTDFTGFDKSLRRLEDVVNMIAGLARVLSGRVERPGFAKMIGTAIGPV